MPQAILLAILLGVIPYAFPPQAASVRFPNWRVVLGLLVGPVALGLFLPRLLATPEVGPAVAGLLVYVSATWTAGLAGKHYLAAGVYGVATVCAVLYVHVGSSIFGDAIPYAYSLATLIACGATALAHRVIAAGPPRVG